MSNTYSVNQNKSGIDSRFNLPVGIAGNSILCKTAYTQKQKQKYVNEDPVKQGAKIIKIYKLQQAESVNLHH